MHATLVLEQDQSLKVDEQQEPSTGIECLEDAHRSETVTVTEPI